MRKLPDHEEVDIALLDNLRNYLSDRVVGQERAIDNIVRPLTMRRADLLPEWRPTAVLFFAGPTGVGKTETALALADFLKEMEDKRGANYEDRPLVKVDSGLYGGTLQFAITKLIGSPPGYAGSRGTDGESKPLLCRDNFPPDRPMVLLFDEIEKAFKGAQESSEILGLLLSALDKGKVYNHWDQEGPVDLRNTVIIFTSNIGAEEIVKVSKGESIGFNRGIEELASRADNVSTGRDDLSEEEVQALNEEIFELTRKKYEDNFSVPELRNRMDRLIVFRFLDRENLNKILDQEIDKLSDKLEKHDLTVDVSEEGREWILNHGIIREQGVRSMQRFLLRKVVYPISVYLAARELSESDLVHVDQEDPDDRDKDPIFYEKS